MVNVRYILLAGNNLGGGVVRAPASALNLSGGTNIGDMTGNGGLAAVFDGSTNVAHTSSATKAGADNAYAGKTLATPAAIQKATVFGGNNTGYLGDNNSVTITLFGKQGAAPASGTDGTSLGVITFTDTADESVGREITSADTNTVWDHVWVQLVPAGTTTCVLSELQLTGWI